MARTYRADAGTVAIPGFSFISDTDTGVYRVSANVLGFAVGGKLGLQLTYVASSVNSLRVKSAITNGPVLIETVGSDTDVDLQLKPQGAGGTSILSTSANALSVGRQGATNPVLKVNAATATVVTGLSITGAATGTAVALAAIGSATDELITFDAKGAGTIKIGGISTGLVHIGVGGAKVPILYRGNTDIDAQNATPTIAQLLKGIITHTSASGAGTCTVPTGAATSAGIAGVAVGDSFDVIYYNDGNQTVTITAGVSGSTVIGPTVTTLKSATLRFVCTATDTWTCYVMGTA